MQFPVPHQILLESRYLPQVWEKEIVLRSFFSTFGVVTGVTLLGFRQHRMQRFIISFKVRMKDILDILMMLAVYCVCRTPVWLRS